MASWILCLFLMLFSYIVVGIGVSADVRPSFIATSTANHSTNLVHNKSSSSTSAFSYIIPDGRTQECNIYGPICQTGSITVGVNMTTSTTDTVMPCSSYLSAQSQYLHAAYGVPQWPWLYLENYITYGSNWRKAFGRSPECRSYADEFINGRYTFSGCGDKDTVIQTTSWVKSRFFDNETLPSQIPPGLMQVFTPDNQGFCCGNCTLWDLPEVRLYYFPDSSTIGCQNNQSFNASASTSSAGVLVKRMESLVVAGSVAIVSGHTFTSPSVYLQVVGTLAVRDHCNTVGPILTSPIITFPPGGLSTWKPPTPGYTEFEVGDIWGDGIVAGIAGVLDPLTIKDLACPTWGLGRRTSANGEVETTIGPPWLPLIVPPSEAFSLDPTWADLCTGMESDLFALSTFAIFDPPIALTVESRLVPLPVSADPTTTRVPTQAESPVDPTVDPATDHTTDPTMDPGKNGILSSNAARPASSPVNPESPVRTGDPVADSPRPSLAKDPNDPVTQESRPIVPLLTPTKKDGSDPSVDSKAPQPVALASSALRADDPPADPSKPFSIGPDPLYDNPYTSSVDPNPSSQPSWAQGGDVSPQNQPSVQEAPVLSFAGSIYTANQASQFLVAGETLTPGGVVTVSGMPISMDPGASIAVIGGSTQLLKGAADTPKPVLTLASSVYTAGDSNDFIIAGKTLTKGGVIVVDGTRLSIDPSGTNVVIGSSTQALFPPIITAGSGQRQVLTFHGSTYTADGSSNFVVDGQTLAQGSAITAEGTQLSYDQAGSRVIVGGTSTQIVSTKGVNGPQEEPLLTFDGSTYTAGSSSDFIIDGHTLSKGGVITVDGTRLSYDPQGSDVVIGTSIQTLSFATITPVPTPTPIITFDGSTYYANDASSWEFVIDGQTLTKGGVVTVHGTPISYAVGGTDVVVGISTGGVGLGGLIMDGFGGGGGSNSNGPVQFTGKAARNTGSTWGCWVLLWGSAGLCLVIRYAMS